MANNPTIQPGPISAAPSATKPVVALTIAGSDSSGGAGIQADLKTFASIGVYGASAITALTAQNTTGVAAIHAVPPDFVRAQINAVTSDIVVDAIKIGMLANDAIIASVAASLGQLSDIPVILDPVMVATSGARLIDENAIAQLRDTLIPRATLITPNLDEAALLCNAKPAASAEQMRVQAANLISQGARAVLLKGGHGENDEAIDILVTPDGSRDYSLPRIDTENTHGTGCTLSAAIAAYLAKGNELSDAIAKAKQFVWNGLVAARHQRLGKGGGPLDHYRANPPD